MIEVTRPDETEKLVDIINKSAAQDKLCASVPPKQNPKVLIRNVPGKWTIKEFTTSVWNSNEFFLNFAPDETECELDIEERFLREFVPRRKLGFGPKKLKPVVDKCSPCLKKLLIDVDHFNFGWGMGHVIDFVYVLQCLCYNGLRHKAANCKFADPSDRTKVKCSRCGETDLLKNCKAKKAKCSNCAASKSNKLEHSALDVRYPIFIRFKANAEKRIDYWD